MSKKQQQVTHKSSSVSMIFTRVNRTYNKTEYYKLMTEEKMFTGLMFVSLNLGCFHL